MSALCDLFFELSSEERMKILNTIKGERSKLTNLARTLGITNQECSRHVSRLADVGLVEKKPDGFIRLTSYANQVLTQLKSLDFSLRHRQYFLEHTTERIPSGFQMRLGELSNSQIVDDVMVVFNNIEKMYNDAEVCILRVTDRFMLTTMPYADKAFERGVTLRMLDPEDIVVPSNYKNTPKRDEALTNRQFLNNSINRCDFFLAMSEKGVAALSFPRTDGRFDYTGLTSSDPDFSKWCSDLFEHYWTESKPKEKDWLSRKIAERREQERYEKNQG